MKGVKDVPEGIWILAVLAFMFSLGFATASIKLFYLSDVLRGTLGLPLSDPTTGIAAGYLGSGAFFWIGFALVALSLFSYFVGKGLLRAKRWTRIAESVVMALVLILAIVLMVYFSYFAIGIALLAVVGLYIWYLFVKVSTKKFFK